jgi:hypothetical protein
MSTGRAAARRARPDCGRRACVPAPCGNYPGADASKQRAAPPKPRAAPPKQRAAPPKPRAAKPAAKARVICYNCHHWGHTSNKCRYARVTKQRAAQAAPAQAAPAQAAPAQAAPRPSSARPSSARPSSAPPKQRAAPPTVSRRSVLISAGRVTVSWTTHSRPQPLRDPRWSRVWPSACMATAGGIPSRTMGPSVGVLSVPTLRCADTGRLSGVLTVTAGDA